MGQIVHRFFIESGGLRAYAGRRAWQGWGVDGDPEGDSPRSRLRLRMIAADQLELQVARGINARGPGRWVRLALRLPLYAASRQVQRRILPLAQARFEADLATFLVDDCRLTIQALDRDRMHAVLVLGPRLRMRFAGSLAR